MIGVGVGITARRGPVTVVSDTFTRADSAVSLGSAETGQAWTALSGTWGISGNKAYLASATAQAAAVVDAGVADGTISGDITLSATSNRADTGIVFRAIDDNNYLLVVLIKTATNDAVTLFKRDAGSFTQLGTVAGGHTNGSTYAVTIQARGGSVQVLRDGVLKVAHTLSAGDQTKYGAATKHGMRINNGASADDGGSRLDNLRVIR